MLVDLGVPLGASRWPQPGWCPVSAPTAVLLARLANILESARLNHGTPAGLVHIKQAQELLDTIRDGI